MGTGRRRARELIAPELVLPQVGNVIRRLSLNGLISGDVGAMAHAELLELQLATLDEPLMNVNGPRCEFVTF